MNLTDHCDNTFNLHYKDTGNKVVACYGIKEQLVAILDQPSRFICLGRVSSQNQSITVEVQRYTVKYAVGTHQTLTQYYPDVAKCRQTTCQSWVEGIESAYLFQKIHAPYIAVHFWGVWDAPVSQGVYPRNVSATILHLVKSEIIDLMIYMYIFPVLMLESIAVRRNKRNM